MHDLDAILRATILFGFCFLTYCGALSVSESLMWRHELHAMRLRSQRRQHGA
jgi:hypothetical protein